jgi:tetratricopeptide (TPR) repeat protein
MIHSWFDSSSATREGELLAQSFISEIIRNAKNNHQGNAWSNAKQKLLTHAKTASRDLGLNVYKKAKLVSVFKSKLVENNLDKVIVDETARVLLLHLWFGGNSEKVSVSPTPGTVAEAELLFGQGNECCARRNYNQAISCYLKAIRLNPKHAMAHTNLSSALIESGQYDGIETYARNAVNLAPHLPEAHHNLGCALFIADRHLEAEACFRQAIKLKPDFAESFNHLGKILVLLSQPDEAEICYQKALHIRPDYAEALVGLGQVAGFKGKFDEAYAYYQRALTIKPNLPEALADIVGLRKMTHDDDAWLSQAQTIVRNGIHPLQESRLRFAMGKFCDDVKDFDQAFEHYRCANKLLKLAAHKYDRQRQKLFVDDMIRTYNREKLSLVSKGGSVSARPVFIVGMPRSGTSLLEQIVASHPEAFGAGELLFWSNAYNKYENTIREATLEKDLLIKLADEYFRHLSSFSTDAKIVVNKMPSDFAYLGLIHSVFPNARFIHTQRHPIDTCLSNYFQSFSGAHFTNDLADLAHYYRQYHRLMAHWRSTLPPDVFLDVPYEALVKDQEEWSRKIVEFIGLDWDERCLDFHKMERRMTTASLWQVRQKMYKTSVERWRNYEKFVGPLKGLMELS